MKLTDAERKPYHHGDLKNALIHAGRALLEQEGRDGLDLRSVARRAGVSHAAPYRHFPDRQALIAAIAEEGFLELRQSIEIEIGVSNQRSLEKLTSVAIAYVYFAYRNPWLMREMFAGRASEGSFPSLYQAEKAVFRIYSGIIRSGQETKEISAGDPNALAGVYWSLIHGVAMLVIDGQITPYAQGEDGIRKMVELSIQTLYQGFFPRAGSPSSP